MKLHSCVRCLQFLYFCFLRWGEKLIIRWRLRRAFFAFGIRQLFLLICKLGDFFRGGEKNIKIFGVEIFPHKWRKKHWMSVGFGDFFDIFGLFLTAVFSIWVLFLNSCKRQWIITFNLNIYFTPKKILVSSFLMRLLFLSWKSMHFFF